MPWVPVTSPCHGWQSSAPLARRLGHQHPMKSVFFWKWLKENIGKKTMENQDDTIQT
jgi:hypothetical protein